MFLRAASAIAGPTQGILANSATGKNARPRVVEPANVPPRCLRRCRTDAGNFGKFRYGEKCPPRGSGTCQCSSALPPPSPDRRREFWQIPLRGKIARPGVAEPANVPPRCLRRCRTDAGNFGKFRYGEKCPPRGSGTCQCSPRCLRPQPDRRREFWQIPLRGKTIPLSRARLLLYQARRSRHFLVESLSGWRIIAG